MARQDTETKSSSSAAKESEGAGSPTPLTGKRRISITNVTQAPILFNLSKCGDPKPTLVRLEAMSIKPTVVEGELAERLSRDEHLATLVACGAVIVDKTAGISDGKRAVSEPEVPDDLKPATEVGATLTTVGPIKIGVAKMEPSPG